MTTPFISFAPVGWLGVGGALQGALPPAGLGSSPWVGLWLTPHVFIVGLKLNGQKLLR